MPIKIYAILSQLVKMQIFYGYFIQKFKTF